MQFTPDHARLLVACGSDDTIAEYDVATHKLAKRFPRRARSGSLRAAAPTGANLYVSNEDDAEATVIDIESGAVVQHYPMGDEPEGVLATPDGRYVFVASEAANLVQVIDVAAKRVVKEIVTATRPRRFAITPDAKRVWVSDEIAGLVEIIDVATLAIVGQVTFDVPGLRHDEITPVDMAISRDGRTAYVTLGRANRVAVVDVATSQDHGFHPHRQASLGPAAQPRRDAALRRQRPVRRCRHRRHGGPQGDQGRPGRHHPLCGPHR